MNRTVQNYQKAYRKKVEGLKAELTSVRGDATQLRATVKRLRRRKLAHAPSLAIGGALGWLAAKHLPALLKALRARLENRGGSGGGGGDGAADAADADDVAAAVE